MQKVDKYGISEISKNCLFGANGQILCPIWALNYKIIFQDLLYDFIFYLCYFCCCSKKLNLKKAKPPLKEVEDIDNEGKTEQYHTLKSKTKSSLSQTKISIFECPSCICCEKKVGV